MAERKNGTVTNVKNAPGNDFATVTVSYPPDPPEPGGDAHYTLPADPDGERLAEAMNHGMRVDVTTAGDPPVVTTYNRHP